MNRRKTKSVTKLELALKAWRTLHKVEQPDLSEIFRTDRQLFLDLASSKISASDARDIPELFKLAQLARRTLFFTPKQKSAAAKDQPQHAAFETQVRAAKSRIGKGEMPKGKWWLFHGIPVTVKALLHYSPELGPDYKTVVRSLKQGPSTKAELKKKTGVSSKKLEPILKRLGQKQMIKNRSFKTKSRLFFEPHR